MEKEIITMEDAIKAKENQIVRLSKYHGMMQEIKKEEKQDEHK